MLEVIENTPIWVWGVFCIVLVSAIKATKTRRVNVYKLFIIPLVFVSIQYEKIFGRGFELFIIYVICFGFAGIYGVKNAVDQDIKTFANSKEIELQGSYSLLGILLTFFFIKYACGYIYATNQELKLIASVVDIITSGCLSGYLLGKAFCFWTRTLQ